MELTAYEWIGVKCDWELVIDRLMNNVGDKKKVFWNTTTGIFRSRNKSISHIREEDE